MADPNKDNPPNQHGEDQGSQSLVDALVQSFNSQLDTIRREKAQPTLQGEDPKLDMDKTIPGGKYLRNGVLVNADGKRIDETGKVLEKS